MGKKISQLYADNPASPLDGSELLEITQGGQSKGATSQQIKDFAGGSGYFSYESYQNSAMSAPVYCFVYRDLALNIYRVYEPVRNNDVSRSFFAYADSIDLFDFTSADIKNNNLCDVKLAGLSTDLVMDGCVLRSMIINGNSHTGLQLNRHTHTGNYGTFQPQGHLTEIYITGDNVTFKNCTFLAGSFCDSPGNNNNFEDIIVEAEGVVLCNGFTIVLRYGRVGAQGFIWGNFDGGGLSDFYVGSSSYIDLGSTIFEFFDAGESCVFGNASNDKCFLAATKVTLSTFSQVKPGTTNTYSISNCDFATSIIINVSGNLTGKNYISLSGTTYEIGESSGNATLTPV